MKNLLVPTTLLLAFAAAACDRPTEPAPVSNPPAPTTTDPVPTSAPVAKPAADAEDAVVDAAKEAPVRARAKELGALGVRKMKELKAGDDLVFLVRADKGGGSIYGSGPYTADSQLRRVVVHAGLISHGELGLVRVKAFVHEAKHESVPANGITPTAWGEYRLSYTVERVD